METLESKRIEFTIKEHTKYLEVILEKSEKGQWYSICM